MKRSYRYICLSLIAIAVILWGVISGVFMGCAGAINDCDDYLSSYILAGIEADTRFLVLETGDIVFSANSSEYFSSYRYDGVSVSEFDTLKDQRFPFMFDGEVLGLKDYNGNEEWQSTNESFHEFFGGAVDVQTIFSFQKGNLLLVKLKGDSRVYLLNVANGTKKTLFHQVSNLHHADFTEIGNFFVINMDNQLFYVESEGERIELLFQNNDGHKLNPFISEKNVFFSTNVNSEYFKIYRISIEAKIRVPELIHFGENDVRLPKIYGDNLFFIEIIAGEYLLRMKQMNTGSIKFITQKGVVYDYCQYRDSCLVYTYSDFYTPKSLYLSDIDGTTVKNIVNQSLELPVSYRHIRQSSERSSAYEYFPLDTNQLKGVILFFHPGLRSDFSPRWDPILINLANNGFRIIAPNYPMSFGFGKAFNNVGFPEARKDMGKWVESIGQTYKKLPIYTLASSSGNILMEHVLEKQFKNIKASASLFGVSSFEGLQPKVPTLIMLGENDPIVDFKTIQESISNARSDKIHLISYPGEGHWLRKSHNMEHVVASIVKHYCNHR